MANLNSLNVFRVDYNLSFLKNSFYHQTYVFDDKSVSMLRDTESVRVRRHALCKTLSDGKFHSGAELASDTGMSRTAIWKNIQVLKNYGLKIDSVHGKGYRIARPPEMLEESIIENALTVEGSLFLNELSVFFEIDSTNSYLIALSHEQSIHGHVALAEFQSQGRGRRGNEWHSPLAAGINLSIGWCYQDTPEAMSVLSLAVGTVCYNVLQKYQVENLGLKWPNDLLCHEKKLAGVLIETRSETAGFTDVVLGIGMNVQLPKNKEFSNNGWSDLSSNMSLLPSRNQLAADLISSCLILLNDFSKMTSRKVVTDWRQYDCITGKQAELETSHGMIKGKVLDVDDTGALLFETEKGIRRFTSGQIRLRLGR